MNGKLNLLTVKVVPSNEGDRTTASSSARISSTKPCWENRSVNGRRQVAPMVHLSHTAITEAELKRRRYAFPEQRKFPLPDKEHVLSAIKFFNYVEPKNEKTLADAILKRMRELGMTDVNVGEKNRFRKYYNKEPAILHSGIAYRLTFKDGTSAYLE